MLPEVVETVVEAPADPVTEIALVDLSSVAHPIWHMSGTEPDPDFTSRQIVARIRSLTAGHPKAAICCDSRRSFRKELVPSYKAQREAAAAALYHQIAIAKEQLEADGYPVWEADGFEADDLIATATGIALGIADTSVLVISADKDLCQLVGPRVRVMSPASSKIYDEAGVEAKYGVTPAQMRDFLCLVGDASDNVKGAKGIGGVRAAELLKRYGSIESIYHNLGNHGTQFKPAQASALREFEPRLEEVRALITLRTDAEIPFVELDNDRAPRVAPDEGESMGDEVVEAPAVEAPAQAVGVAESPAPVGSPVVEAPKGNGNGQAVAVAADVLAPAPADFTMQLEPRSIGQAFQLAKAMHESRLFLSSYGTPAAVLSTILAGRELGLQAMASLRGIHIVEGRHMLAADLLRALVLKSGKANYFRCVERTAERATFETQRGDDPPMSLTYTIEEAQQAGMVKEKSGWVKNPADMLVARASSKLARLVYPEIVHGLYAPEEFDGNGGGR